MNKLNYAEYKKLDSDSQDESKQKATDKLKADNKVVFDALQQIDTDLENLATKYGDELREAIQEFYELLQGLDTRGINKVELLPSSNTYISTSTSEDKKWARAENFSVDRLGLYCDDIRFKATSTSKDKGWSAPITITKTSKKPSTKEWAQEGDMEWIPDYERKFDKLDIPVTFNALTSAVNELEDIDEFVMGIRDDVDFDKFMSAINKINNDYRAHKSVLKTQGHALYSRIVKLQSQSEDEIDNHLKKLINTEGLIRPSSIQDNFYYGSKGKFIITSRLSGEDGYLQPYKLKVKTNTWDYTKELECELTFIMSGRQTQTPTLKLPKKDVERWIRDLFIIKYGSYSHDFDGAESFYQNALNSLEHMPRLNTSPNVRTDNGYSFYYNLHGNKKERALRDSFGEWVDIAQPKKVVA